MHICFGASMCEVLLRAWASVFETWMQAHAKVQIRSSTLAVELCSRSAASSMLAVKLCACSVASRTLVAKLRVLSQRNLESTQSLGHTRSFAATIVEASTHSCGSKLRYTRSFYFFSGNGAPTSLLGEVRAPFETELTANAYCRVR